jgi:hypothetical protein
MAGPGIAPAGIHFGISLCFAYAVRRGEDDDAVDVMSQAQGNPDKDARWLGMHRVRKSGMNNQPPDRTRFGICS